MTAPPAGPGRPLNIQEAGALCSGFLRFRDKRGSRGSGRDRCRGKVLAGRGRAAQAEDMAD
ncbi:hypothetical protein GCM10011335_24760 [Aureimonas glaciei]|uniref:Uncharacterized protein n=1 Tax=Aureimonas glaciei TaxID=1776957 RepID=A0A916XY59_9HYPH|nr:hypothetical protein GCM10011335_24760 [Aureimonas glaciei]